MEEPRDLEALIWEARARIIWGDPANEVADWLQKQGVEAQQIEDVIRVCEKERDQAIRRRGIREIFIGGFLLAASCVIILLIMYKPRSSGGRAFGFCILCAIYGFYRLVRGLGWLFEGGKTKGSLTDMGEDGI